jgi:mono/diheme cytochrome c family protein
MKTLNVVLLALGSIGTASCGPKDVIPTSPTHPANPDAPTGQTARATPPDAGVEPADTGGHEGHEGHGGHGTPPPDTGAPAGGGQDEKAAIAAAEKAAYEAARPVFEKYCSNCHSAAGKKSSNKKLDHFNLDSYPFGGHHAAEIGETIREVLGVTGEEATMPKDKPGAVNGAELDLVVAWSKAFDASHKAGLHDHGTGGHEHGHGGH